MGKIARILLYSAGGIALVCGIAGIVYGTNNKVRTWVDDQIDQNATSSVSSAASSSSTSVGSSSTDKSTSSGNSSTSTPVVAKPVTIVIDKNDFLLDLRDSSLMPSCSMIATLGGDYGTNSSIIWEAADPTMLSFGSLRTVSGQSQTILCRKAFTITATAFAHSAADYSVIAEVKIRMYNHLSSGQIETFRALKSNNDELKGFGCLGSGFSEYTYNPGDGNYFHMTASTVNDGKAVLDQDKQKALTDPNVLDVTASSGFKLDIQLRCWNYSAHQVCGAQIYDWDFAHPDTLTDTELTTSKFTLNSFYQNQETYNDYYALHVRIQVNDDTQTGRYVLKYDNRYWCMNFTKYVPAASTSSASA
jgi:hypothetical protein